MTGGSGAIYGIRLLDRLNELGVETHLVMSDWAKQTIAIETDTTVEEVRKKATVVHHGINQAASISSGSFQVDGMVIAPCSMKTLAGIASGFATDLITRAADVILKEKKKLILVTRETPLNLIHIKNMETVTLAGGVIYPPMPAFYNQPKTVDDIVNHTIGRVLDQLGFDPDWVKRWQ